MGRIANRNPNCKNCGVLFDSSNEIWDNPTSRRSICVNCRNAYLKANNDKRNTPEYIRRINLRAIYGMTPEEYDKLVELQQGGCAICRQSGKLVVDHNHETNEVRGLLCHDCNIMVGNSKEDEDIIWNMLEYLKRTTWNEEGRATYKKIEKLEPWEKEIIKIIVATRKVSKVEAFGIYRNTIIRKE